MKIHTILALMGTLAIVAAQEPMDKEQLRKIAQTTGQWGGDLNGLIWKRSVKAAVNETKPIMVLHLFGKLDEEFC
ncbi:MAG: hypothetical protein HRU14_16100 [Planctomycetes bacterium]|nr:hypothetical protein [Planctomycetota bacterium]